MKKDKEIEVKFILKDASEIRKILKKNKAKFKGRAFERTVRLDSSDKKLERVGKFLRVRTGFKKTVTFKKRVKNKNFKERIEIELKIEDEKKMIVILKNLGFSKALIMEKYREKWNLLDTEIVIDKLPMGLFIEIEGEEKAINKMIKLLKLDSKKRILLTYWDIWKDFAKKNNIKDENITFE